MNMCWDGYGGVEIETNDATIGLDRDECLKLSSLIHDGMCIGCDEEIRDGSILCCDCFNAERRWHSVHCETSGKQLAYPWGTRRE